MKKNNKVRNVVFGLVWFNAFVGFLLVAEAIADKAASVRWVPLCVVASVIGFALFIAYNVVREIAARICERGGKR